MLISGKQPIKRLLTNKCPSVSSPCKKKPKNNYDSFNESFFDTFNDENKINSKDNVLCSSSKNTNSILNVDNSLAQPKNDSSILKINKNIQNIPEKKVLNNEKKNIFIENNDFSNITTESVFQIIGLSKTSQDIYRKKRKISNLYDWQKECITNKKLLGGRNFILSLQTGAGKTLIAELLMLRETLVKKRSCIMILPYVAIVQEKIVSLSVLEELGIYVEEYAGSKGRIPPVKRKVGRTIYVATIEKGNILINSLVKENRLDEIGLVVIDELHMIGEKGRGAIIEQLILKYNLIGSGQTVGMSATLGNVDLMCKFMNADHFYSDFRPVELIERVKLENNLYDVTKEGNLIFNKKLEIDKKSRSIDNDGIITLIKDIVPAKSVIIFCPTKKNCENKPNEKREEIINNIKNENDGEIEEIMEIGIRAGVAYHHSGLTSEERHWIEYGYQSGILYALCATSTLAAGVNLPARRVIIKQPLVGGEFLGKSQYKQMVGRAGRAGYDDKGESITIVNSKNELKFKSMLKSELNSCQSQMLDGTYLEGFILDLIYLRLAKTKDRVSYYLSRTLAGIQSYDKCFSLMEESLQNLVERDMLKIEDDKFVDTFLGEATFVANFSPDCANLLNSNLLQDLNRGVVFSSHFHLILTLIPYDIGISINWDLFHDEFRSLCQSEKLILAKMNIEERDILNQITSRKRVETGSSAVRLYITFMMMDIWNKIPISNVAKKFNVQKGWLQTTLQSVCSQAQRIQRFSELLEKLWPLKLLLPHVIAKLNECKNLELAPLMNLDCVKFGRAKLLYEKGFKTVKSIADAKPNDLLSSIGQLSLVQARRIIKSAKTAIDDLLVNQEEQRVLYGLTK
ncbi:Mutagen-sensitive 301 [Strongyloides ratti]|uniref:Mutagen-sensitive 301 n=1 Tax=Strongyloides ratti TaxID=34506 RepID=A0A090L7L1_STRRB|nr:Mutagen-sensitive 301 [Strongyloides ratti]CEF63519.1 Mutagen-sensitive 301 [Strongyloides ratti]